jgi:hypothetical protein
MSVERRKRREERVGVPEASQGFRDKLIWGGIVVVLVLAYAGFRYRNERRYDAFAKCLTARQAKMYGAYWCPHCADQKEMFGRSFRYVNYVECAIKGSREIAAACKAAGVQHFPSWQFGTNPLVEGVFPLEELGDKTGCSLP